MGYSRKFSRVAIFADVVKDWADLHYCAMWYIEIVTFIILRGKNSTVSPLSTKIKTIKNFIMVVVRSACKICLVLYLHKYLWQQNYCILQV